MIHPANSKSLAFPFRPLVAFYVPDIFGGVVLIEKKKVGITLWFSRICIKPSSKGGGMGFMLSNNIFPICILLYIKDNPLLVRKVDLKANHIRDLLLHVKHKKMPYSLWAANVPRIQILLDLIPACAKLHGGAIVALIHIFVDVLDSLDRSNRLHINVTPVLPDEIRGVTDDPLVVDLPALDLKILHNVAAPGASIRVLSDSGLWSEGLGKTLGTGAIDHARSIGVLSTTETMNHELLNKFKQLRIVGREFRGYKLINALWSAQLGMVLEKDNDVGMRKATLLKFNGI
jgi:hypothetical protein